MGWPEKDGKLKLPLGIVILGGENEVLLWAEDCEVDVPGMKLESEGSGGKEGDKLGFNESMVENEGTDLEADDVEVPSVKDRGVEVEIEGAIEEGAENEDMSELLDDGPEDEDQLESDTEKLRGSDVIGGFELGVMDEGGALDPGTEMVGGTEEFRGFELGVMDCEETLELGAERLGESEELGDFELEVMDDEAGGSAELGGSELAMVDCEETLEPGTEMLGGTEEFGGVELGVVDCEEGALDPDTGRLEDSEEIGGFELGVFDGDSVEGAFEGGFEPGGALIGALEDTEDGGTELAIDVEGFGGVTELAGGGGSWPS
ncbi:hypothetical protein P280DRAFT_548454 [Massarina eburnea CBS 473.64]|uniref:Uncharacterized protein n=1 Tax=Massarina eburnea CBS 473.64 TaxID=1395130 RepID=A0A6A6S2N6_9PLEO|nr:hypothetical protein P280DRAFT_548454 [Massarina eburnea CBS 473.64]